MISLRGNPARQVSRRHVQALRTRLLDIAKRLKVPRPNQLAAQLAILVNGAFVSSGLLGAEEATGVLLAALKSLAGQCAGWRLSVTVKVRQVPSIRVPGGHIGIHAEGGLAVLRSPW